MKRISSLILIFAFAINFLNGQIVYPGDVTNNGEVNGIDGLYIGLAYGQPGGSARASITSNWTPQNIDMLWGSSFFNGLNHAYADCNGNGEIDDVDLNIVALNYGKTWGTVNSDIFPIGTQSDNAELYLNVLSTSPNIIEGDVVDFSISLGTSAMPVTDFYGITFTVKYDPNIFQDNPINFELSQSTWIDTDPNLANVKMITIEDVGEAVFVITRIDNMPIEGSGILGTFEIVVDDIVIGLTQDTTTNVTIEDVVMMNQNMSFSPIYSEDLPVTISNDTALVISSLESYEQHPILKVFPNPAKDLIIAESSDATIDQVTLYDLYGRKQSVRQEVKSLNKVYLYSENELPTGIYIVSVNTEKGILSKKIFVE